ncbi:MAG TPA: hypothetical protein VF630_18570, partial [Hymenobacter sp.]
MRSNNIKWVAVDMKSRYELSLYNPARSIPGFILAFAAVATLTTIVANYAPTKNWALAGGLIALLAGGLGAYRLLRWWAKYEVVVFVKEDQIAVQYIAEEREKIILFSELASYRYESFNGREVLCLKLRDGSKVKMVANDVFGKVGDFSGLSQAVGRAVDGYRGDEASVIVREPSFFEKPISTIMLVVVTALYVALICKIVWDDLPISGNMITGVG